MRYLSRNKVYEKVEPKKDAKKIYIFCEGEQTEIKYFNYFRSLSSNIDIIPIPSDNGKTDPQKLKESAELLFFGNDGMRPKFELSEQYKDEVWFVIDTDRWNEKDKIQILRSFCDQKSNENNKWRVAQSNPCFEVWFYYHIYKDKPQFVEVAKFDSFKSYLNSKIKGGFDSRKMPIELEVAIANSKSNFEAENNQPKVFSTEVYCLGEVIINFVKSPLDKIKEMMKS